MYHVYVLHSPAHNKYYVGQTQDLNLRLKFHNELSKKSYTSKYRPWKLKKSISFATRSEAILAERAIKKRKSKTYITSLITNEWEVQKLIEKINLLSSAN